MTHHPAKQHVHIHEHLQDNLINGKGTVRVLARRYRLEIVVIVRTDKSIQVIKKIILRCPKISLCRICERVFFFPLNLHTSEVFLALGELFLIEFCVFSVLIKGFYTLADFGFSLFETFRFFYLTEKSFFSVSFWFSSSCLGGGLQSLVVRGRLLRELGTVEPRLSRLVGT